MFDIVNRGISAYLEKRYGPRLSDKTIDQTMINLNKALAATDPLNTAANLLGLKRFVSRNTFYPLEGQLFEGGLYLVAHLYHVELRAAMMDKGVPLTLNEVIAAFDVLLCVITVNRFLENGTAIQIYEALNMPDAYWENVQKVDTDNSHVTDDWPQLYASHLKDYRDNKIQSGSSHLLTHAEIQGIINASNCDLQKETASSTSKQTGVKTLHTKLTLQPSKSVNSTIMERLFSELTLNCPQTTFNHLQSIWYSDEIDVPALQRKYSAIYHSFIVYNWQRVQISSVEHAPLSHKELITSSINSAHNVISRIERLTHSITDLNKALTEKDKDSVFRNLKLIEHCWTIPFVLMQKQQQQKQQSNTTADSSHFLFESLQLDKADFYFSILETVSHDIHTVYSSETFIISSYTPQQLSKYVYH